MRKTILLIILLVALGTSAEYPAGEKLTIVCVGDSITYGYGLPDREHNAWPAQLQALLGGGQAVLNLGVSGTTALRQTGHSYVNTPEYRTALNSRPDIVLIKLGTNDSRPYYRKYIDSFYRDYKNLVDSFVALPSHPRVILLFPVPDFIGKGQDEPFNSDIPSYILPVIRRVAAEDRLDTVDLHTLLAGRPELFPDKLHPDAVGAGLIAGRLYQFLRGQGVGYEPPSDTGVQARLKRWQGLKFGLFMHWGTYSEWGVVESWSICPEDYDFCKRTGPYAADYATYKKAYENLQATFNPTRFDPAKWAAAARDAGMRYVVFTTKHHDGFCMFDTKYTNYRVTDPATAFSSDPRANVSRAIFDAFRRRDMMIGAYFSKVDWHSDNFWWPYFPPKDRYVNYDIHKYPERWKAYQAFNYHQVEELMTGYGPVDLLWLDGDWAKLDMAPIAGMARQHQPGLIVVDRHGEPSFENYLTPEQKVPGHYIPVPWEACMTMGNSWSYHPGEVYKSTRQLVQLLVDVVAKGGNLLLDIGPGPDGEWQEEVYRRLAEIGRWIRVNGESVYNTHPYAPYRQDKWAFTTDGKARFVSYLPADGELELPAALRIPVSPAAGNSRITLLGAAEQLSARPAGDLVEVSIPATVRKALAGQPVWVFKIEEK